MMCYLITLYYTPLSHALLSLHLGYNRSISTLPINFKRLYTDSLIGDVFLQIYLFVVVCKRLFYTLVEPIFPHKMNLV